MNLAHGMQFPTFYSKKILTVHMMTKLKKYLLQLVIIHGCLAPSVTVFDVNRSAVPALTITQLQPIRGKIETLQSVNR